MHCLMRRTKTKRCVRCKSSPLPPFNNKGVSNVSKTRQRKETFYYAGYNDALKGKEFRPVGAYRIYHKGYMDAKLFLDKKGD